MDAKTVYYVPVGSSVVDPSFRTLTQHAAHLTEADLGLPPTTVSYYRRAEFGEGWEYKYGPAAWAADLDAWEQEPSFGFARMAEPDTINLSTDLAPSLWKAIGTVAHEQRHRWQFREGWWKAGSDAERERMENDAYAYAAGFVARLQEELRARWS